MQLDPDVIIEDQRWLEKLEIEAIVSQVSAAAARELTNVNLEFGEFSVLFADNAKNHELNLQWRKIDKTTNVLAFPSASFPDSSSPCYLGDISIALEIVSQEAQEQGKTLQAHVSHLVLHGLLHLFGYDHETVEDAARMESFETKILASLGIDDPYV